MIPITNTDPHHAAKIYRGTGKAIEYMGEIPPLSSRELEPGHFYWADTTRVSFDAIDAAVAKAWAVTRPRETASPGAVMLRQALERAA